MLCFTYQYEESSSIVMKLVYQIEIKFKPGAFQRFCYIIFIIVSVRNLEFRGLENQILVLYKRVLQFGFVVDNRYHYKFIVGGHWRHSNSLPTNVDQWGNINNVIQIGDVASYNIYQQNPVRTHRKDSTNIKVIERPLTEDERFTLAFASRRMACSISPLNFKSKRLSK
jgi:hypothetical protein